MVLFTQIYFRKKSYINTNNNVVSNLVQSKISLRSIFITQQSTLQTHLYHENKGF